MKHLKATLNQIAIYGLTLIALAVIWTSGTFPVMAESFSHIALNCIDPIATEVFYTQHFGFQRARVAQLPDGSQIVFIKSADGGMYLELFETPENSTALNEVNDGSQDPGIRHLAFKVDDVDAKIAAMGEAAKITLGPLSFDVFIPGWRTVWIADPDGRIVEIGQGFQDEENPLPLEF